MALKEFLNSLPPSGAHGFEGLIRNLLESLLQRPFHLAKSGYQGGRDASSQTPVGSVAVECKRYDSDTPLSDRELLGELAQAAQELTDLDLWILTSTRDLPDRISVQMRSSAEGLGVEFRSITGSLNGVSQLEVLCAHAPAIVLAHAVDGDVLALAADLKLVAEADGFALTLASLREALSCESLGLADWAKRQNAWLQARFRSELSSRAAFGVPLDVDSGREPRVDRPAISLGLDGWLAGWERNHRPIVLLGEEGDGKTWAVASWTSRQIETQPACPAVIWITSDTPTSNEPLELIVAALTQQLGEVRPGYWRRRLQQWLRRPSTAAPVMILIIDGVNEGDRGSFWRRLFEQLAAAEWAQRVAVVITCRGQYWRNVFGTLRHLAFDHLKTPPFDDAELDCALRLHSIDRNSFSSAMLPLLRKPRYLQLAAQHHRELEREGDFTLARLLYEDWRDRLARRGDLANAGAFENLIRHLAAQARRQVETFSLQDVASALPSTAGHAATLQEMSTTGILKPKGGGFRVNEDHLVVGLALLLADRVAEAAAAGTDLGETIASWLEPHRDMDLKARILESAALHALLTSDVPCAARVALLHDWLVNHNRPADSSSQFSSYFPSDPQSYFQLSEVIWQDARDVRSAQEQMMATLLRWSTGPGARQTYPMVFERWLSFVHPEGAWRSASAEEQQKRRDEVQAAACRSVSGGDEVVVAGRILRVIDDPGLLRLGRAALAVISQLEREPFLPALVTGVLADNLMRNQGKDDVYQWVFRSGQRSLSGAVEQSVHALIGIGSDVALRTAYDLLTFVGTEAALATRATLPADLFPTPPWIQKHHDDPCSSGFQWDRNVCAACVSRSDIPAYHIARQLGEFATDPSFDMPSAAAHRLNELVPTIDVTTICCSVGTTENDHRLEVIEPVLCRVAPEILATVVQQVASGATGRRGLKLRQVICSFVREQVLVLRPEDWGTLHSLWQTLQALRPEDRSSEDDLAEQKLFGLLLWQWSADEQLANILARPADARDLTEWELMFRPLPDQLSLAQRLGQMEDASLRRSLWFLSASAETLPPTILPHVVRLLGHPDSFIRSLVLEIAVRSGDEVACTEVVDRGWAWAASHHPDENHWGSLCVGDHARHLTWADLKARIWPPYLGRAVATSGMDSMLVQAYAADIDALWRQLPSGTPSLPPDLPNLQLRLGDAQSGRPRMGVSTAEFSRSVTFVNPDTNWGGTWGADDPHPTGDFFKPPSDEYVRRQHEIMGQTLSEQWEAGNTWFAHKFTEVGLDAVIEAREALFEEWVAGVTNPQSAADHKRLALAGSFNLTLCEVAFKVRPARGVALWFALRESEAQPNYVWKRTDLSFLEMALFLAPDSVELELARETAVNECTTDEEISRLVRCAELTAGDQWLGKMIDRDLAASTETVQARAITMLGFSRSRDASARLRAMMDDKSRGWLADVAAKAHGLAERNRWAETWYTRFLASDDEVQAWAAFRLFLRCVDRRFWFWREEIDAQFQHQGTYQDRRRFADLNLSEIEHAIDNNEKGLGDTFLAQKVLKNQASPWMAN